VYMGVILDTRVHGPCMYTGISSGPNAGYRVWEAFTFTFWCSGILKMWWEFTFYVLIVTYFNYSLITFRD